MKLLNISQSVELDDTFSKNKANHSVDTNNAEQENIETKRPDIFNDDFQGFAESKDIVFKDSYSFKKREYTGMSTDYTITTDDVNGASGLPMIDGIGGVDTNGNPCGFSDD